ncbi:ISNCY family transposase, partial [Klebsiella michiganensis]|nr:ISNCY family transposase [Klebsiella michiganensis]
EGKLEGKQEGRQEEALRIARSLLEQGFERELVRMTIGLSDDDLNAFQDASLKMGEN